MPCIVLLVQFGVYEYIANSTVLDILIVCEFIYTSPDISLESENVYDNVKEII